MRREGFNFLETPTTGFLAGLSVGVYCLGLCLPVFLPILLSEKRNLRKSFLLVFEFSIGRLLGYLVFGLIFGWLGQTLQSRIIHQIVSLGNLWTGLLMILYSLGMIERKLCRLPYFNKIKWPLLLGLLTGVNICPPFIASLTYVFNLRDVLNSLIYFLMFFLGTSVYIIPSAILGLFTRIKWLNHLARISGVFVGLFFVVKNLLRVF